MVKQEQQESSRNRARITIRFPSFRAGNLKIKCVVSVHHVYHRSNEVSVEVEQYASGPRQKPGWTNADRFASRGIFSCSHCHSHVPYLHGCSY